MGVFVKNLGMDSNMPVWKGVHVCLERGVVNYLNLERGYRKWIFVNDMKHQR